MAAPWLRTANKYILAAVALSATVALMVWFQQHINLTTAALALVLLVMLVAVAGGSGPALAISVAGMLCFSYFFIPPIHSFTIRGTQNWIALFAFVVTAIVVGQLSSRNRERTTEAEMHRREGEKLYKQLKDAAEERNQAEALRRADKLKTALLDAVTHDLRTPLTSIKASVSTLLTTSPEEAHEYGSEEGQRELLEIIDEEADRLNRLVERMMSMAQIEAGRLKIPQTAVSASEIIEDSLARADVLLRQHQVEVTVSPFTPFLLVDAPFISQVFFNLLENAAKYSPAGSRIHVAAEPGAEGDVEFSVQDEGCGIPVDSRERVFEKFFRLSSNQRKPGFGLGLAIARGIVEAHGGRIWIDSGRNGKGTRVVFRLPVIPHRTSQS